MHRETRKGCLWGCCERMEKRPERGVVGIEYGIDRMRKVLPINTAGSRPLRSDLPGEMARMAHHIGATFRLPSDHFQRPIYA